jgi:hypothetical protein
LQSPRDERTLSLWLDNSLFATARQTTPTAPLRRLTCRCQPLFRVLRTDTRMHGSRKRPDPPKGYYFVLSKSKSQPDQAVRRATRFTRASQRAESDFRLRRLLRYFFARDQLELNFSARRPIHGWLADVGAETVQSPADTPQRAGDLRPQKKRNPGAGAMEG